MVKIISSPETLVKETLTGFQVYLNYQDHGLVELFTLYQGDIAAIQEEIGKLQAFKKENDDEYNNPQLLSRFTDAPAHSPINFLTTYILESKRLAAELATNMELELPEDTSPILLHIDEEQTYTITQQDLRNTLKFLEIMCKDKNTPIFELPYFGIIPLTTEKKRALIKVQSDVRKDIDNYLSGMQDTFSDKSLTEITLPTLEELSNVTNAQALQRIIKRFKTCGEMIDTVKKRIKTDYERCGMSKLAIEDTSQEAAFHTLYIEITHLQDRLTSQKARQHDGTLLSGKPKDFPETKGTFPQGPSRIIL